MPANVPPRLLQKLQELDAQHDDLARRLMEPEVLADHRRVRDLSIKKAQLAPLVEAFRTYRGVVAQIGEMEHVIAEGGDPELAQLAREELPALRQREGDLLTAVQKRLVRADERPVGALILEVRAGVGGDEAGIWAGDLLEMYRRYASTRGWRFNELQLSPAEQGGFKSAIVSVAGEGAWTALAYEGGTHQVKRVPATEAQGRVHTSTATVAVLPEPEEIEVTIAPGDVREIMTTAQGPGGQNVNKVATAVHLIHEATGIEVRMQETKSQAQNRQRAWQILRARLYERQRAEAEASRSEARMTMIGSGDRAEKIRTYRYKENLVVDHRIGRSFNLAEMMAGGLQPLVDELIEHDTARRLAAL
jgi:peptide chain release factor 1